VPSWSWMRLANLELSYLENIPFRSTLLDTVHMSTITADPTPTPFIQIPKLSEYPIQLGLSGRCMRCFTVKYDKNDTWTLFPTPGEPSIASTNPKDNEQESMDHPSNETIAELYQHRSRDGQRCYFYPDIPNMLFEYEVLYCLLLKRQTWADRFEMMHIWDFCLVLKQSEDGGHFTRVGVYAEDISALDFKDLRAQASLKQIRLWNKDINIRERFENGLLMFPGKGAEKEIVLR
jgi:hypothetical protein